jgi:hypothetical protein
MAKLLPSISFPNHYSFIRVFAVREDLLPTTLLNKPQIKFSLVHAIEAYGGSRCIAPLILNLETRWRWEVNVTFLLLYPWEPPPPFVSFT